MQREMVVQRQRAVGFSRPPNRDRSSRFVIGFVSERDDDVEAVDGAAQQDNDQARATPFGGGCPGISAQCEEADRGALEKLTPARGHRQRRMKSGLPRISAARNAGGARLTTPCVAAVMVVPKIASKCAVSTGLLSAVKPSSPRARAAAKPMRRVVASGLSQASSVFLYPSGVRQPSQGI